MDALNDGIDANEALQLASGTYGRFDESVQTITPPAINN